MENHRPPYLSTCAYFPIYLSIFPVAHAGFRLRMRQELYTIFLHLGNFPFFNFLRWYKGEIHPVFERKYPY